MWKQLLDSLRSIVTPESCIICREGSTSLCEVCASSCTKNIVTRLPGLSVPIIAPFSYTDVRVRRIIHAIKYRHQTSLLLHITPHSIQRIQEECLEQSFLLVPIPMSPWRRYIRGKNHAEEFAAMLSAKLGTASTLLLEKETFTRQLSRTHSRKERFLSIKGSYAVNTTIATDKSIPLALVDDVITSGATMTEALNTLTKEGYTVVACISIAH